MRRGAYRSTSGLLRGAGQALASRSVPTRFLIIAALLCGIAILLAFAAQVLLAS